MASLASPSSLDEELSIAVLAVGVLGGLWLMVTTSRTHPIAASGLTAATALLTALLYVSVEKIWRPFADPVDFTIYVAIEFAFLAVILVAPRVALASRRICVGAISLVVAAADILTASVHVNGVCS